MTEKERLDEELETLSLALRRLPTPMPPDALVSRVRRLAHLELAAHAEERLNRVVMAFLLLFSWAVSLFGFAAVRLVSGESWSAVYFVSTWISGAVVLVLLGVRVRKQRRLA